MIKKFKDFLNENDELSQLKKNRKKIETLLKQEAKKHYQSGDCIPTSTSSRGYVKITSKTTYRIEWNSDNEFEVLADNPNDQSVVVFDTYWEIPYSENGEKVNIKERLKNFRELDLSLSMLINKD